MPRFSDEQIRRYSRQILLREVGGHGQRCLGAARPGLFCPGEVGQIAAEYLWRAGVTELALFAPTQAAAAQLTEFLEATGYPGPPARELSAAAEPLQRLASTAPGCTLLWLTGEPAKDTDDKGSSADTLVWACCYGTHGTLGQGVASLHKTVADRSGEGIAASASGAGAMILSSALALLTMQRILGIAAVPTATPDAVWQFDLNSPELPAWR